MRLKSLRIVNNPKLNDLYLDFTVNGKVQDTIIFAGDNGCGKTTILDEIFFFISLKKSSDVKGKAVGRIILSEKEKEFIKENLSNPEDRSRTDALKCITFLDVTRELEITIDFDKDSGLISNYIKIVAVIGKEESDLQILSSFYMISRGRLNVVLSSFYSQAVINYELSKISSITSIDLNASVGKIKTSNDIGTDVKQTLIDIYNLDAEDYLEWAVQHEGETIDITKSKCRINLFAKAFNYMFDNIKFDKIITRNGYKDVIFKNINGNEISIDDLSSGEKQIVLRGGYALKNLNSISSGTILIDEPELSLHPNWQKKILQFYKNLFTGNDGIQTAQIFVATHSPFIIHNPARYNDKVIILKRNSLGQVEVSNNSEFYDCNGVSMVKDAFNIEDFRLNKNILFTEGKTDEKYLKKAIEIFFEGQVDFEVKWIGKENEKGNPINTGKDALNNVERLLDTNPGMFGTVIGLLYDCDTNKKDKETNTYFEYCLENIPHQHYKIGVENLLNLPLYFDYDEFYSESKSVDDYGALKSINTLNKNKLCDFICSSENSKEYLKNFENIIREINEKFIELKIKN